MVLQSFGKGFMAYLHRFMFRTKEIVKLEKCPEVFYPKSVKTKSIRKYFRTLKSSNIAQSKSQISEITVLVFNTEYSKDIEGINKTLNYYNVDLALLSELDDSTKRVFGRDTIKKIASDRFNYIYGPEFWEDDIKKGKGFTGNAIFSRFKLYKFGYNFYIF